jgi:hypothetical protein
MVFEPIHLVEFEVLHALPQTVHAVFRYDSPLAHKDVLRLRDCLGQKLVLPSAAYGVRNLLEMRAKRIGLALNPALETEPFELIRHYVEHEQAVGALSHKTGEGRSSPYPIRTQPTGSVTGMPRAV